MAFVILLIIKQVKGEIWLFQFITWLYGMRAALKSEYFSRYNPGKILPFFVINQ